MIIGLSGSLGSGKDTIAEYLKKKGFSYFSLSDVLREEAEKRGLEKNRDNLQLIGNELRESLGPGILAHKFLEKKKAKGFDKALVVSIRNPKEVDELRKEEKFILINVDAPIYLRYQRIQNRKSDRDQVSFEEFKKQEELERESTDPNKQQLNAVAEIADYNIDNSGSFEDLYLKIEEILKKHSTN